MPKSDEEKAKELRQKINSVREDDADKEIERQMELEELRGKLHEIEKMKTDEEKRKEIRQRLNSLKKNNTKKNKL